MSLSQILVLGTSSSHFLSIPSLPNHDFANWLLVLEELCKLENHCVWDYAPNLPRALVSLLLGRPLKRGISSRVVSLLARIDENCPHSVTVVQLVIEYISKLFLFFFNEY
ncbi:unnamed protein product [Enterobius vermicularis]|uniref:Rho-GAP domain-containing protein n=1 Tax=Enterobius vermicularis TaxID=51028 RepID=A0A0N4UZY6_ENTVE|nr:unnamed protein product [Enterobius vermicularis]